MKYIIEEFVEELSLGHEFEIKIDNKRYGISWSKESKILLSREGKINYEEFDNVNDFISNAKIEDKLLKDIWEDVDILIQY